MTSGETRKHGRLTPAPTWSFKRRAGCSWPRMSVSRRLQGLVAVGDGEAAGLPGVVEVQPLFGEDRLQVVVVIPSDEDDLRPLLQEAKDSHDLPPLGVQVAVEGVLEVPVHHQDGGVVSVQQGLQPLLNVPPLEAGEGDPLLPQRPFVPQVEVRHDEGPRLLQVEGVVL